MTFIIIVLFAGVYWTHKAAILRITRIAFICAVVVLLLFCVLRVYRGIRKVQFWLNPRSTNFTEIDAMTGLEFERYIAQLLKQHGYQQIRLTEKYDYGVDIIGVKDGYTWGIQVKRSHGLVKANAVRQVVTALRMYGCDRAMVITNGEFSRVAIDLAASNDCVLIDRLTLSKWFK
ncbi:MAG: restriction endonuclease [Candidatus Saccharibacteria bacterium]|nr:restriction endonuclease [Candidatus Saccharibacteria bacterium]